MDTIKLDTSSWDLTLNASGNIATQTDASAIAQDVASAIRLFEGELFYDVTLGVPYYSQVLGKPYAQALVQGLINEAALTVPGVVSAQTTLTAPVARKVTGECKVIDATGQSNNVHF